MEMHTPDFVRPCLQGVDYAYACEQLKSMRQVTDLPEPILAGDTGFAHIASLLWR